MKTFASIYQRAAKRKGGEDALQALLPDTILSDSALANIPDDRFLSQMTKSIFQAGFNWGLIDKKWPGFEQAFWKFNIRRCAAISPDDFDQLCKDQRIVRNPQKIATVSINAVMVLDIQQQHGSFARFIADWPGSDFIGLLAYLNKHGSRLGGSTAQYFLRYIGKDGFALSRDGVAALIDAGVVSKNPTSKADLKAVQNAYNTWMEESGYGLAVISRILGLSIDAE